MSSWQKTILGALVIIGLTGLGVLVVSPWSNDSCNSIFKQAAPKLEAHLEIIRNKGALAISQEKIQKLSESAQKVGLHLKTCCFVLEGGKLDPTQFQQCVNKASAYENKIAKVAQQITKAVEAQERGASELQNEALAGIDQTIQAVTRDAESFVHQVKEIQPPSPPEPNKIVQASRQVIARTEAQKPGVYAEIQKLKRDNGIVTLNFTMTNDTAQQFGDWCYFIGNGFSCGKISGVYLFDVDEKKKYPVLSDADGQCICSEVGALAPESRVNLWAKFPAPPANVQKISVIIPHFNAVDGVPISR